jgi:hypothetical protein
MSDWSEGAALRSAERQKAKQIRDEKSLRDRTILADQGKVVWSNFRSMLGRMCEEFNLEPGRRGTLGSEASASDVTIKCINGPAFVTCKFDHDKVLFFGHNGADYSNVLSIKLTNDGLSAWLADSQHRGVSLEYLADNVITAVLQANGL